MNLAAATANSAGSMQIKDVVVDGVRVRLALGGHGPPLLLIHGFLVSRIEWDDVVPLLLPHHQVIAIDLPGFGESGRPEGFGYDREAYAALLAKLLLDLGLTRAHVAGHSYGGSIAIVLAARHPERVERLALIDSVSYPFPVPFNARLPLLPGIGKFIFKKLFGRAIVYDYFRRQVFSGHPVPRPERLAAYYDAFDPPAARDAAYRVLSDTLSTAALVPLIAEIRAPTLVVFGDDDRIIPTRFADRLARDIPQARAVVVPGCGHAPNEERPEETAQLLLDHFLARA